LFIYLLIGGGICAVDRAERAVIAALLKHNNLVEEAHLCAQMLTKTEPKQTRSLHHIWEIAYKVRVWILEQFQKLHTETPQERSPFLFILFKNSTNIEILWIMTHSIVLVFVFIF
jgi:hypothetical protein